MSARRISCAVALSLLWSAGGCSSQVSDDDDDFATPGPSAQNQSTGAGAYALDYLTDSPYSRLYVEIDYMEDLNTSDGIDNAPSQDAIDALLQTLERFCSKTSIVYDGAATDVIPVPLNTDGTAKTEYKYDEINGLELQYRDRYRSGSEAVMYFLYVNGKYVTDDGSATSVVGFAHHGSSMAVFKGVVNSIPLPASRAYYERTVVVHEMGHLLGLVTTGIPAIADHVDNDPTAGKGVHCSNEGCMMYWAVNSAQFLAEIINGAQRDFDADCQDDMSAAGGKTAARPAAAASHPITGHGTDPFHPNVVY